MIIYIEYVLIDNMIIDGLLVYFSLRLCRFKIKKRRVLMAACIGTSLAIVAPLLNFPPVFQLMFKIVGGVLIVLAAADKPSPRKLAKLYAVFLALTFAGGGAALMIVVMLSGSIENGIYLQYNYPVPVGLIIGGAFLGVRLLFGVLKTTAREKENGKWHYKVEIEVCSKSFETTGFVDSGNRVFDKSGLPVCFVDKRLFGNSIDGEYRFCSGSDKTSLSEAHFTEIGTLGGDGKILVFKPDKMKIYFESGVNIIYDVMLGISLTSIDKLGENCRLILHPSVVTA